MTGRKELEMAKVKNSTGKNGLIKNDTGKYDSR